MTSRPSRPQLGAVVQGSITGASRVVNWRSPNGEPEIVTITLVPIVEPSGEQAALVNSTNPFRAKVTWGHGDAVASAVVDYPTVGGTFTLTGSSVTVDVYPEGFAAWSGGANEVPGLQFGAFMALGASRPSATPPTYTVVGGTVWNATTGYEFASSGGVVPIPRFARAYYVADDTAPWNIMADTQLYRLEVQNRGTPYPEPGALTTTLRRDSVMLVAATDQLVGPTPLTPFPLPPRATHVQVTRVGGFGSLLSMQVVFVLDLGA